jgi:hypothetical protein
MFPTLTFGNQNCNSLNLSTSCEKQLKKIATITESGKDFIFLSDIRLSNNTLIPDLKRVFLYNKIPVMNFSTIARGTREELEFLLIKN